MNVTKKARPSKLDSTTTSDINPTSGSERKLLQIQRDILYSKYLEAEFLKSYLRKKNKRIEKSWDEQLTQKNEAIQAKKEEIFKMQCVIKEFPMYTKLVKNYTFLDDLLTEQLQNIDTKQVEQLLRQLQNICDKIYIQGLKVQREDQDKLVTVINKLSQFTSEIKEKSNSDYCSLHDKIRQIDEVSKQIGKIQNDVGKNININNELVLKTCSLELTDRHEYEE